MTSRSSHPLRLALAAVVGASGLALTPSLATAAPASDGFSGKAVVLSPFSSTYTVGDDGTDRTVRLEAGADSTVSRVRFDYQVKDEQFGTGQFGQWMPIETVNRNDDGLFAIEWEGAGEPVSPLATRTVNVRAVPLTSTGQAAADVSEGLKTNLQETTVRGVNLTNGSALGYFKQPYEERDKVGTQVAITGTTGPTGATNTDPRNRTLRLSYATYPESGATFGGTVTDPQPTPAGSFVRALDISGYSLETGTSAVNQLIVRSELLNGAVAQADETEAYALYSQTITEVTATPDRANVAPGEAARVTVAVTDQDGEPVVGAQVMRVVTKPTAQDPVLIDYTGADGTVTVPQDGDTTAYYYANGDDLLAYSGATGTKDRRSADVAITAYQAVTSSLRGSSADGPAFDLDEVDNAPSSGTGNDGDTTDVTVQVLDQKAQKMTPAASQQLSYYWTVTPFAGGSSTRYPATGSSTGVREDDGAFSVVTPNGGDGTYELFASLSGDPISSNGEIASSRVLTVKAGQAAITYDKNSPEELPAGATSAVTGRLALSDGTTLPGRALSFTFQRDNTTTNEDPTPDAGFGNGQGAPTTSTTVTTTSGGTFSLSVNDPAENPQLSELGDNIDAASAGNELGNAGASQNDHVVNFVQDPTPTNVVLTDGRGNTTLRPGEFTLYTVKVANRLGGGVAGRKVTLTTDKGYFSKDDGNASTTSPTPSPAPANGADAGTFQDDGKTVELTTGPDGTATVFLAMGRDAGFDDDGLVTSKVTATSETFSANDDHSWTSANPLNGGTVAVVPSSGAQESGNLPKAQLSDKVLVDVELTDQFGNLVGGETVTLADDSATGSIAESDGTADDGTIVSDFTREGDATLTSTSAAAQKLTASWSTERTTYSGGSGNTTTGNETLTGSYTVEWYAVDYAASSITLTPDAPGTRRIGTSVTMTYRALDQLGQPISDLYVDFARTGPGATTDPATAADGLTGADGIATYTFTGSSSGTADVTATARQGSATGQEVGAASRSASVTFAQDAVKPDITVKKALRGNRLVLKVTVTASTQDPVVGDVRVSEDGDTLATKVLNDDGKRKFVIRGVEKGFHSYQVTFLGNDEVKTRTRTVNINVR